MRAFEPLSVLFAFGAECLEFRNRVFGLWPYRRSVQILDSKRWRLLDELANVSVKSGFSQFFFAYAIR